MAFDFLLPGRCLTCPNFFYLQQESMASYHRSNIASLLYAEEMFTRWLDKGREAINGFLEADGQQKRYYLMDELVPKKIRPNCKT